MDWAAFAIPELEKWKLLLLLHTIGSNVSCDGRMSWNQCCTDASGCDVCLAPKLQGSVFQIVMAVGETISMNAYGGAALSSSPMARSMAWNSQDLVLNVDSNGYQIVVFPCMTAHPLEQCVLDASI